MMIWTRSLLVATAGILGMGSIAQASVIAHWNFNAQSGSTVTDVSGNALDGSLVGTAALSSDGAGQTGNAGDKAIVFNATAGSHMVVNNAEFGGYNPGANSYSVAYWVKRNHPTSQGGGLFDFNIENGNTKAFQSELGNAGNLNFMVGSTGAGGGGTTWSVMQLPNGTISDTNWHHVAMVLDRSGPNPVFKLYLDGSLTANNWAFTGLPPSSFGNVTFESNLYLGQQNGGYNFQGMLDDFMIFDEALTAQQVSDLYNNVVVPEPASLALLGLGGLMILRRGRRA